MTPCLKGRCSNQLSYGPMSEFGENTGRTGVIILFLTTKVNLVVTTFSFS